jgi:NADH dehydrogenase [ubiquinone] 1 alpha subcomplex assembly factor 5
MSGRLSRTQRQRTSIAVPLELFDMQLRALRRDRAFRRGPELFLYERAFADCLDRIGLIRSRYRRALLIGCPDRGWIERLGEFADRVEIIDPGPCFAHAAGGQQTIEDQFIAEPGAYNLCVAVGTLDTINDLPQAFARIRMALAPGAFLLGAMSGGETLPQLRTAMRAADQIHGEAVPHVHPRIEAAALAALLSAARLTAPVVDVDRVQVSYEALTRLIGELRSMGSTNILNERSRQPLSKVEWHAAVRAFTSARTGDRTTETFEILHFAAWVPPEPQEG